MENFTFHCPTKVIFGKGAQNQVGAEIAALGCKNVIFHYGGGSIKKTGLYDAIVGSLKENDVKFTELPGVEPNPKMELVRKGVELCKAQGIDFILAVGGGSVIDSAKAIAMGAKLDFDVWELFGTDKPIKSALPIGVILTISAAGSETSPDAVISNNDGLLKKAYGDDIIRPVFSIMNPELTETVSEYQTACGVVDIMMHTYERYFTPTKDGQIIDRLCEGLALSVIGDGEKLMKDLKNYQLRANIMWAGSISHNGLFSTGRQTDWATHQLEHELSAIYDIAHGAGLAIMFPAWCKFVYKTDIDRFYDYATKIWGCQESEDKEKTVLEGIEKTERYFKQLGMPTRLSDIGVTGEDVLDTLAEKCTYYGTRTIGRFMVLGREEIRAIYELAK